MHPHGDADLLRQLRGRIAEIERRAHGLVSGTLRHDVNNAVGAARNALTLLDEEAAAEPERFLAISRRNIERAERLLGDADGSARDERNDLGRERESNHRDAFGL